MPADRRQFLKVLGGTVGAALVVPNFSSAALRRVKAAVRRVAALAPEQAARDEDFWFTVQHAFTVDRGLINLNNGGVSPSPRVVQDALKRYNDFSNNAPTRTMWGILQPELETVRKRLARLAHADPEEIAITRNTTESLHHVLFGIDLERGDEILTTNQDYPRMLNALKQRELREGIVVKRISVPVPPRHLDELADAFERAMTPQTKLVLVCHMVNLTGQIYPVRKICDAAHARGIPVVVDGAHTFAHVECDMKALDCDYFGTSLHKWLTASFGTGMLYVKRERIASLWPLFAHDDPKSADIRKFEQIGTFPVAVPLSIGEAISFYEGIGPERKRARLRYLTHYWTSRLAGLPRVRLHTNLDPEHSCALATVEIEGIDPGELSSHLLSKHHIIVTPIVHPEFKGIRVTPNVYTLLSELDQFVAAMKDLARNGLPG
ncbi:MAG: aminotransferase class V-fold PLP-dependent enzyme [Planctomycetota bacterium]